MEERNCRFLSGAGESVHTSSSGLQPRAKRKRPPSEVLPPARWPFPSASEVLEGLGCEGNVLASVRRRKVGALDVGFVFPASAGWRRRGHGGIKSFDPLSASSSLTPVTTMGS